MGIPLILHIKFSSLVISQHEKSTVCRPLWLWRVWKLKACLENRKANRKVWLLTRLLKFPLRILILLSWLKISAWLSRGNFVWRFVGRKMSWESFLHLLLVWCVKSQRFMLELCQILVLYPYVLTRALLHTANCLNLNPADTKTVFYQLKDPISSKCYW